MAKKRKGQKPPREFTRHQLSRWQRQKRIQKIIFATGIFLIAAILVLVGTGWYITQYRPMHQTVIRVNGTEFDMSYYLKILKASGQGRTFLLEYIASEVGEAIEINEVIRQGALELGISVSDEEIDAELQSYDPPLSSDYHDIVRADLLLTKLGDEYFDQQIPESAEQRHIMVMLLESESQALEARERLQSGEDFAELAAELSLDSLTKDAGGDLDWHTADTLALVAGSTVVEQYAFTGEVGQVSQPLYDEDTAKLGGYWLLKIAEKDDEVEDIRPLAILLPSLEEAEAIRDRAVAGEDFAALVEEFSQHESSKEDNGNLGFIGRDDIMFSAFGEDIFEYEVGDITEPIRDDEVWTTGGYWLVKVEEEDDDRPIEGANRDILKSKLLDDWVASLRENAEVENYLDESKISWAVEKALEELE